MADSCQCMAKKLQYCGVVSLQLIKVNEKKKYLLKKKYYESSSAQGYVPGPEVQQWKKQALVPALQEIYTHSGEQELSKETK